MNITNCFDAIVQDKICKMSQLKTEIDAKRATLKTKFSRPEQVVLEAMIQGLVNLQAKTQEEFDELLKVLDDPFDEQ